MARKECSVGGRDEEEMYEKTEFVNVAVSDSIRSTRTEGEGGRGVERNKERVARGVRAAKGKGSESDLGLARQLYIGKSVFWQKSAVRSRITQGKNPLALK